VRQAFARIKGAATRPRPIVVNKSTVAVGTHAAVAKILEDDFSLSLGAAD